MIRKSKESDLDQIKSLIERCFGDRTMFGLYEDIEDRYYIYILDDKIVAITGLGYNEKYNALEVCYTCTHPDHRHKGYMQELFRVMLGGIHEDVYCSCWRLPNKDINLHTLMYLFNFEKVLKPRVSYKVPYNCQWTDKECVNCTGSNCECWEDLYLRKYNAP